MSQNNYNSYTHITLDERIIIACLRKEGRSLTYIAREIGKHKSSISREILRNSIPDCNTRTRVNVPAALTIDSRHYRGQSVVETLRDSRERYYTRRYRFEQNRITYKARIADEAAVKRRTVSMQKAHTSLLENKGLNCLKEVILELLKLRWSPEQISLRLELLNILLLCIGSPPLLPRISHETIYQFIYRHKELKSCLRRRGKPYRHNRASIAYNATNRTGHGIADRPAAVKDKKRAGDLEGDTIFGKNQKDRLLTHYDRTTKVGAIGRILDYNAWKISQQTITDIERVFGKVKTITYDNGSEFVWWETTEWKLGATIYFAEPYSPWQRGGNENFNGLVRDFFPKGTDFAKVSNRDILKVETLLNNRPRKSLGGFTPLEFAEMLHLMV